jgi:hypothetical protein
LAQWLSSLFEVLNAPQEKRLKKLDEQLLAFPYVNGSLFAELLPSAAFDTCMRQLLLDCCALGLEPDFSGDLRQPVSVGHGHYEKAESGRALHHGKEHPQADQAAVSGRATGRI